MHIWHKLMDISDRRSCLIYVQLATNYYWNILQMRRTLYCILWFLMSTVVHTYVTVPKFKEVHELNLEELPIVDQLAPRDPALHSFPAVPLLPNCMKQGYLRDPFNCGKFYRCEYERDIPRAYYCQSGLIFNTITESCDQLQNVQCWILTYIR